LPLLSLLECELPSLSLLLLPWVLAWAFDLLALRPDQQNLKYSC
jgi:hypothetical protein